MFFLLTSAAVASATVIDAPVDHLYVPKGFDSNDSVEVVVTGTFPNPCYSRNGVKVDVKNGEVEINVMALAPEVILMEGMTCPDMPVQFKEVVTLGNLQGGTYSLQVNGEQSSSLNRNLKIAEASSQAVDEYLYADVEWIEKKSSSEIVLHGFRSSDCLDLDKIKVVSNGEDTLSVLPILKQVSKKCNALNVPVSYPVKLDLSGLKTKRPLLHVRTIDGKSVNTILSL